MAAIESMQPRAVKRAARRAMRIGRLPSWPMRAGLWVALALMLWTLSGSGHPILSRLTAKPQAFRPFAPLTLSGLPSSQTARQAAGLDPFQTLRLGQAGGEDPVYRSAARGKTHFAHAQVSHSFNNDYHYIGRSLLPVREIGFDRPDGLRTHVNPASGRLAILNDRRKDGTEKLFRWMHAWSPIQPSPWVAG